MRIKCLFTGLALTCVNLPGGPRGGYSVEQVKKPSNPLLYRIVLDSVVPVDKLVHAKCALLTPPKSLASASCVPAFWH
jgi:hypothetical protein